ncbi:ribbon-helix-helix protein, CopG family [Streptomyces sp. RTGN2]|uniref:ribbon-helix-helix protein, CopG family n=1 Tax=unclassified Streptomyces TaxID=2593676 RepID=UPI0025565BA9|nr:ribbon-helix-helix protein, CopG family [Streptomyces sp. RTGN2]
MANALATLIVKLVPAQKEQLERVAADESRSMSAIVRIALGEYLDRAGEVADVVPIRPGGHPRNPEAV